MKNLKVKSILFSLLAVMAVAVFLTSCEQENSIIEDEVLGWKTSPLGSEFAELVVDGEISEKMYNLIMTDLTPLNDDESIESRTCCAGVSSVSEVTSPSGDININIQYEIGPNQEVDYRHYAYQGGVYRYTIGSSYDVCTPKGVNTSTGQLPTGRYCTIARLRDFSSGYCGSWKWVVWEK